jgi:UPF0176 protein
MTYQVAAFYQFAALPDFRELREPLRVLCAGLGLKGSVLLAHEGINGTLAGEAGAIGELVGQLRGGGLFGGRLDRLELKFSQARAMPDTLLIDTRNAFEVAMGTFAGAVDPGIKSFGQFKEFAARHLDPEKHRRIAMFCTGGIRCEKASSYLLSRGFAEVYHLKGGILKYLEGVPEANSRWRGECFVFDERVALGHGLRERQMERQSDE